MSVAPSLSVKCMTSVFTGHASRAPSSHPEGLNTIRTGLDGLRLREGPFYCSGLSWLSCLFDLAALHRFTALNSGIDSASLLLDPTSYHLTCLQFQLLHFGSFTSLSNLASCRHLQMSVNWSGHFCTYRAPCYLQTSKVSLISWLLFRPEHFRVLITCLNLAHSWSSSFSLYLGSVVWAGDTYRFKALSCVYLEINDSQALSS